SPSGPSGALTGCHGTGLELDLAVLGGQPELYLGTARLLPDGGHLPRKIRLEAVEVKPGAIPRGGGEPLVERLGRLRVDAVAEADPLRGIVAPGRRRRRTGGGVPPLFGVAQAPVEQLVVAVESGLHVTQPEGVHGGRQVAHAAELTDLRLDASPQLLRREGEGTVAEALEVDPELLDVAVELSEGGPQARRLPRSGPTRARPGRSRPGGLRRLGIEDAPLRASLRVHGSPRMLGAGS